MKTAVFWALIALNALLLTSFLGKVSGSNSAVAQTARRPGDYVMIPGNVTGTSSGLVYIVDTSNSMLTAMSFNENTQRLENMPKIDLTTIFTTQAAAPTRGAGTGVRK